MRHRPGTEPVNAFAKCRYGIDRTTREEVAPRPVLRSIHGLDDPRAWLLRELAAPKCKEALDSIVGMDGAQAWALRDRFVDLWPSTTVKSLGIGPLATSPRGREMIETQLRRHPTNLSLLKQGKVKGVRFETLERICDYLECQPGDILKHQP